MASTALQIAGNHRRSLRSMKVKLLEMADQWEDSDEFIRGEFTDLADQVQTLLDGLASEELSP